MIAWGLLAYYLIFFLVPWGTRLGYEAMFEMAPNILHVPGPPWVAYALAMISSCGVCLGISALGWTALKRDDVQWGGIKTMTNGTGWLGLFDLLLPVFLIAVVCVGAYKGAPMHGVLAAVIPMAIAYLLGFSNRKQDKKEERVAPEEPDDAQESPQFSVLTTEPLIAEAKKHAGTVSPRDTHAHTILFRPPRLGIFALADPEPFTVTWIITREEQIQALAGAPKEEFGQCTDSALKKIIESSARHRAVSFLGEQITGDRRSATEDKIRRLTSFLNDNFQPEERAGRLRLPIACLAEAKATESERTLLLLSMALSNGMPIALWRLGEKYGMAVEGLIQGTSPNEGFEHFDMLTGVRYTLVGAHTVPDRIIELSSSTKTAIPS